MRRAATAVLGASIVVGALALLAPACAAPKVAKLIVHGDKRQLRERAAGTPPSSPDKPPILYLAFDGVGRDLLYDMLRKGKLPHLAGLLGGAAGPSGSAFPHAHFDEHLLSTLPSSTMAAWATTMTGVGPAVHGITGNEFFIRETRELACPAPVSFADSKPTIEIFTDAGPTSCFSRSGRCSPTHSRGPSRSRPRRSSRKRSRVVSTPISTRPSSRP